MSLRTDYLDGVDGISQKMAAVVAAGTQFVVDNTATLSTKLKESAGRGEDTFTVTLAVAFEPGNLRLKGKHLASFFAGVRAGLAAEDLYDYEYSLALNTSDQINTSIDIKFHFTPVSIS